MRQRGRTPRAVHRAMRQREQVVNPPIASWPGSAARSAAASASVAPEKGFVLGQQKKNV